MRKTNYFSWDLPSLDSQLFCIQTIIKPAVLFSIIETYFVTQKGSYVHCISNKYLSEKHNSRNDTYLCFTCDSFLSKHYHRIVVIRYPPCNYRRRITNLRERCYLVHRFQYLCKLTQVSVRYFFTPLHFDFTFSQISLSIGSWLLSMKRRVSLSFL